MAGQGVRAGFEVLESISGGDVVVYCHGCGAVVAGASSRRLLRDRRVRVGLDRHALECPGLVLGLSNQGVD